MPSPVLDLRPAKIEDAALVADLDTLLQPDEPRDPALMAFWWTSHTATEKVYRLVRTDGGAARMFVFAGHNGLHDDPRRFGSIRVIVHPADWTADVYRAGVDIAEAWLRDEGAGVAISKIREDRTHDIEVLHATGYEDERRLHESRLDLIGGRERLLATAERTREDMERQGITMTTLDRDPDPDRLKKLYELDLEATDDIPKTAPWPVPSYDEWMKFWFDHPGHQQEHFWIARDGDAIVGLSVIGYPPTRGIPWTAFTCTARSARGRGIARALKYASVKQAIELGVKEIATQNDGENAPILHLNDEMGYRPAKTYLELHKNL